MGRKVHIVFVKESGVESEALDRDAAGEDCELTVAHDMDHALRLIADRGPDLVVCPWAAWCRLRAQQGDEGSRERECGRRAVPWLVLPAPDGHGMRVDGVPPSMAFAPIDDVMHLLKGVIAALLPQRATDGARKIVRGDLELDLVTRRVTRGQHPIHLSHTGFRLLQTLMEEPERVFGREELLRLLRGEHIHVAERTIDVHVGRLRKALTAHGDLDIIRTVRGVGYALASPDQG